MWGASLASVQTAIRLEPQLEALVLLAAIVEASLLILGGAIGDTRRARPIVLGGLAVELLTALASLAVADGPLFALARILGMAASAFVIPVSLAAVATSYSGTARATAIGIAYAGYGLGTLAGPILLEVVPGVQWPAYVLAVVACAVALMLARRWLPDLDRPSRAERPYVAAVAWWGLGIVALTTALIW
ncbi:MAG TPA: MFS transporter, partial [Candidatus Limnocylindrales bacterium]